VPHPKVKISDNSGNEVGVTSNRLNVNAFLQADTDIEIGNVDIQLNGTAVSADEGDADAGTIRITIADDDNHFGAVGAASDADGVIHGQLRFLTEPIGTSGVTGPSKSMSVAGTASGGALKELLVDSSGHLQVDVLTAPTLTVNSHAVTNAGTFAVQVDGDALTSLQLLDNAIDGNQMQVDIIADGNLYTLGTNAYLEGTTTGRVAGAVRNNVLAALAGTDNEIAPFQVDTQGALYTTHGMTGLASDDNDTVGTSAEKISGADGDVACKRVDIMAHPTNTGYIWIGDSAVTTNGANGGIRLAPGDFYSIDIDNTGDVYVAASVADENVYYTYFT